MNVTFVEHLNAVNPNDEMIEVAARAFLSELSNDALHEEMRERLLSASSDADDLDRALNHLSHSPQERRDADLAFLCWAWDQPEHCDKIRAAFRGAAAKLPSFESALLALIALYGMYLVTTGGVRKITRTIKRRPDGTFEELSITEYESPVGPMSVVGRLFSGLGGKRKDP